MTSPCPRCGGSRGPEVLAGLCPLCLLVDTLSPPELPEALAGTRFGDYELLERIASGGMGVVFRARKQGLERVVAVKMVHGGKFADERELQRFRGEAQDASTLDHPNIVPIYEVGEHDGCPYFTMRLMVGGTLAAHLEPYREHPRRSAELVACLARAVSYGHQRGILHCDLKPANVLLDAGGSPAIADFGTARRINERTGLTRTGAAEGTPAYMSPEQARGDARTLTTAADVYGLGAILYELLTGQPPFAGPSPQRVLQLVRETEPARPRTLAPTLALDLETICLKCLEKPPERRYHSAEALAEDLERYLRGEAIAARPIGPLERTWRWAQRHPVIAVAAALLLLGTPVALLGARHRQQGLRRDVLAANVYAARMTAGTVLFQLREYADGVQRAALEPSLLALLGAPFDGGVGTVLEPRLLGVDGSAATALEALQAPPPPLGEEVRLPTFQRVSATERYRDPVDGFDGGWLAGLAPVGQTGLVVVVQTRD